MKVGDLVRVCKETACGGVPNGALGLVIEEKPEYHMSRWVIWWLTGNEIMPGVPMKESTTYGHGVEVISENR
jgi:hypothetical protein